MILCVLMVFVLLVIFGLNDEKLQVCDLIKNMS